ncbi:MAG TPA: class I SAM-dependent methyltransferase, partial [Actinoplanes sp.]|nr:class I SAM-dependent methyltransferase [Actinoplanes sp.]
SGVSGFVLSAAAVLPGLRATTLELIPAVAAVAIARAKELGVDDRIDVRVLDARDLDEPSAYDAAFWAQPFFPEPTRAATLAMILRSLRPGGLLLVQQMNVEPTDAGAHAEFTLRRLVAHAHDVPHGRPLADVVAEAEQAGFEPLTITQTDFGPIALVRRPR